MILRPQRNRLDDGLFEELLLLKNRKNNELAPTLNHEEMETDE